MKVHEILSQKKRENVTMSPTDSVLDALKLMADLNIGSVIIMEDGDYKGIVTERDYSRKVILEGKSSTNTQLAEIMSTDLPSLSPSDELDTAMQYMTENKNLRYIPVFHEGKMIGIISMSDVVSAKIERQKETIGHLRDYISAK